MSIMCSFDGEHAKKYGLVEAIILSGLIESGRRADPTGLASSHPVWIRMSVREWGLWYPF